MAQGRQTKTIFVVPTISTSAYSTGNQLGGVQTLTQAAPDDAYGTTLHGLTIVDKAKVSAAMDILFFNSAPTITSTDRTAFQILDANAFGKYLGSVSVAATDYITTADQTYATVKSIGLPMQPLTGVDLYAIPVIRASATYAALNLEFCYHFLQDLTH